MKLILYSLFAIPIAGCHNSGTIDKNSFLAEVQASEAFVQKQECLAYNLTCRYLPAEFLAMQELRGQTSKEAMANEISNFSGSLYFELIVNSKRGENVLTQLAHNQQEYGELLNYLNNTVQGDLFMLKENGDTLPATSVGFVNSYGMSPDLKLVITFPKTALNENKIQVALNNRLLECKPLIKFDFRSEDLTHYKKPLLAP